MRPLITIILFNIFTLSACTDRNETKADETNEKKQYQQNTWVGVWEDGTGFWLKAKIADNELSFSRSGEEAASPTTFTVKSISSDYSVIELIEKSDFAHYRHTLKLQTANQLKRSSFDLDEKALWGEDELTKKDNK